MGNDKTNNKFEFQNTDLYAALLRFIDMIYNCTSHYPANELYGLTGQLRRAAVSILLNYAEGWGRPTKKDKIHFYNISRSSIFECVAALDISLLRKYLGQTTRDKLINECDQLSRMFSGLIKSLK